MRKIIWPEESEEDQIENIDYILDRWTEKEAQNFIKKVEKVESQIKEGNVEFLKTDYKGIHLVPIDKHVNLFYRNEVKTQVEFLRFWNTAKDPKNLKLK